MWWKPYAADIPHHMYSLSKSVTSMAVGFAVSEGLISYDDSITKFFQRQIRSTADKRIYSVTIKHLLTMTSGAYIANEATTVLRSDWVSYFLNSQLSFIPGKRFNYNSINTYILAAIVIKVTGMPLMEYLTPRLFEPLAISDIFWSKCPLGRECGGWGLHLKTEDTAKLAQLLLDDGVWEGKQILPLDWVSTATANLADCSADTKYDDHPDVNSGYGMQFWRNRDGKSFRMDGMLGQYGLVLPQYDMVIATTAGHLNQLEVLDLFWEVLIPHIDAQPLSDYEIMQSKIAALSLKKFNESSNPSQSRRISGRQFDMPLNTISFLPFASRYLHGINMPGIAYVKFNLEDETPTLTWKEGKEENTVPLPFGGGFEMCSVTIFGTVTPAAVSAKWLEGTDNTLVVVLRDMYTPHARHIIFEFKGNSVECTFDEYPSFAESAKFLLDLLSAMRHFAEPAARIAGKIAAQVVVGKWEETTPLAINAKKD
jgi:CubicO group peptidase (beta-lactamase class C family)